MRKERETVARVSNKLKRSTCVDRVYPRISSIQSQPLKLSFKLSLVIEGIVVELQWDGYTGLSGLQVVRMIR